MEWSTAHSPTWCGLCGAKIAEGERVVLLTRHRKTRCQACATQLHIKALPPVDEPDLELPGQVECPYCGRVMSQREKQQQGACNDCQQGGKL